ncbi:hypothetical protein SAMD00023378_4992 [Ralstonia sp. NT80]|nr:hypothetical protein SAMD00023378_4992 [Ralstonia sp. NT80]
MGVGRWWSIPFSYPAGHDTLFFVLPKKSKQKKGAPEMATPPSNLRNRAGREANSLRSNKPPSFIRPLTKIQGAIKGRNVKGHTDGEQKWAPRLG